MKTPFNKKISTTLGVLVLLVGGGVLVHALWYAPVAEIPTPSAVSSVPTVHTIADPTRLRIPVLAIDAKIQYVGITTAGLMGVPTNFTDVGWYKYGPRPGEAGSAVIAGHVDNGVAAPGVFKHIEDLKPGDDVYIETSDGTQLHFVVTGSASYERTAKVPELFTHEGPSVIRLITCTGAIDTKAHTHQERLVVTAVLQE